MDNFRGIYYNTMGKTQRRINKRNRKGRKSVRKGRKSLRKGKKSMRRKSYKKMRGGVLNIEKKNELGNFIKLINNFKIKDVDYIDDSDMVNAKEYLLNTILKTDYVCNNFMEDVNLLIPHLKKILEKAEISYDIENYNYTYKTYKKAELLLEATNQLMEKGECFDDASEFVKI